jgi:membrane protease YdiL (CAAX protease family)
VQQIEELDPASPAIEGKSAMSLRSPNPDNPPWGSWTAVGVWIASLLVLGFFSVVFLLPYTSSLGLSPTDQIQFPTFIKTDATAVFLQFIGIIPAHLLTLALAWFVVTRNRKYSFKEMLGWNWGGFTFVHAVLVTVFFYLVSIAAVSYFGDVENDFDIMLKSSKYIIYLVAFFAVFTAPIVEEVVYRGLLYSAFQRTLGKLVAVILVTIMFAGVHSLQYSKDATPDYAVMSVLVLLSLLLTIIRASTGNLLPCIVLHTVFNAFQSVLMIAEPFLRPFLETTDPIVGAIRQIGG